jgi:hypothetical protein
MDKGSYSYDVTAGAKRQSGRALGSHNKKTLAAEAALFDQAKERTFPEAQRGTHRSEVMRVRGPQTQTCTPDQAPHRSAALHPGIAGLQIVADSARNDGAARSQRWPPSQFGR